MSKKHTITAFNPKGDDKVIDTSISAPVADELIRLFGEVKNDIEISPPMYKPKTFDMTFAIFEDIDGARTRTHVITIEPLKRT